MKMKGVGGSFQHNTDPHWQHKSEAEPCTTKHRAPAAIPDDAKTGENVLVDQLIRYWWRGGVLLVLFLF